MRKVSIDNCFEHTDVNSHRESIKMSCIEGRSEGTKRNSLYLDDTSTSEDVPGLESDKHVLGNVRNISSIACHKDGIDSPIARSLCSSRDFNVAEESIKEFENNSSNVYSNTNDKTQEKSNTKRGASIITNHWKFGKDHTQTDVSEQLHADRTGKVVSPLECNKMKAEIFKNMRRDANLKTSVDSDCESMERASTCSKSTEIRLQESHDSGDNGSVYIKEGWQLVSGSEADVHEPSDTQAAGQIYDKPPRYKCLKCSRVMKDRRLIDNHSCDNEFGEEKVKITITLDTDKKSFVCKECDYSGSGHSFEEHLMCHLMVRPYQCLYCKECFINRKEISRHVLKSHNGAKMSCALRALRKAKALIKEVTTSGTISFMAKVAGKVPLEKDPERKKKLDSDQSGAKSDQSSQNMTESGDNTQNLTESGDNTQNMTGDNTQNMTESGDNNQNMTESGQSPNKMTLSIICDQNLIQNYQNMDESDENAADKQSSDSNNSVKTIKMISVHKATDSQSASENLPSSESQPSYHGFSKLREVLTVGSSAFISNCNKEDTANLSKSEENSDSEKACNDSDSEKACNDSGLKIIASFSLQNLETHEYDPEKSNSEDALEPHFIMAPLSYDEKGPELVSFLGPESPIFRPSSSSCTPMLPPPPLYAAALHSSDRTSQSHVAGNKQHSILSPNYFVCGFNCLFSSLNAMEFQEHTTNFHCTETFFPCFYCGHRSPNETDLVRHISNHTQAHNKSAHLYVCGNDGCRFGSNMVSDYINHIKISHPDIPELLCYSCGDTFPDCIILQSHVEDNVIHIVNCPHCPSKATDRKAILSHISSVHPGRPRMVSVAKQLICHDRKVNNYGQVVLRREMQPPALTPAPLFPANASVSSQILSRHNSTEDYVKSSDCVFSDILTSVSSNSPRDTPSPSSRIGYLNQRQRETTPESGKSPVSDFSDFESVKVKEEIDETASGCRDSGSESRNVHTLDESASRKRVYVPMSERQAENYRCKHCTFIARDFKRVHCHEKSHEMTQTRKERFKCMFCPQGFDSEMKFRLHITCHPGLIKFLLYRCKKCEFDTNQKHTMVRHITCNRDRKHRGFGPVEDQFTVVSRSLESRVLECERCDYMTRHKIHMSLHYQREHNIIKDRGEFTVEGITPTDTPLSSYDLSPQDSSSLPSFYLGLKSPDSCHSDSFDFMKPSGSAKKSKDKAAPDSPVLTMTQITERNDLFNKMVSQQAALQPGYVQENLMRKFKCPICQYLLPKAADLKNHVKRHSEVGQITLIMFRCKYCSCMSTARELLYEHLAEKHPGKPIALVKKIVAIDTTEVDKSFAETSMEESLDQLEESLHKDIMSNLNSGSSKQMDHEELFSSTNYEQIFVVPEDGETFNVPLKCPKCSYSSYVRSEIILHVSSLHAEVKVIGSDDDVEKLVKATRKDIQQQAAIFPEEDPPKPLQISPEEVLIVPDDQIFKEPALCSRCNFSTLLRREMVLHLQQNHPEISVMGRNSYPVQVSGMGHLSGPLDESCVVGSGSLDAKLRCLYENYGTQMKCLICGTERPKKFFIHVHILRHLNIYLWKCAFCAHRGLQKYKMVDHIKKIHAGKPLSVRYLRINVEAKVAQFLAQFSTIKNVKNSKDKGNFSPLPDDLSNQASKGTRIPRQKSPGPSFGAGCSSSHALGSDELDEKINCLYDNNNGAFYKCMVCSNKFQRKFAMHRHIIMSHLKVSLLTCAYCSMEGVERHQLVDHILACHKPAPVSILPLDIDLSQRVSDFLTELTAGEMRGGSKNVAGYKRGQTLSRKFQDLSSSSCNKKLKLGHSKSGMPAKSKFFDLKNKDTGSNSSKMPSIVDPDVVMLGRLALDKELSCLYQELPSGQLRCLVCRWEFPRKYALHRHVLIKHLKINLVACPYCPFEGIEKYNVSTHIQENHEDKPVEIKYLQPDVGARVRQFVEEISNFEDNDLDMTKDNSQLIVPKIEQKDEEGDNNNDDDDDAKASNNVLHGGLVVAMFVKKKQSEDTKVVKTEVGGEDYHDTSHINSDDEKEEEIRFNSHGDNYEGGNNSDGEHGDCKNIDILFGDSEGFYNKHPQMKSFTPGSYRSPAGGKPKALDVITKIKVLKSKEGSVVKFYCEKCKFTSLHRSNIVRHIYKIHEKYQTHTCPMCSYQTLSLMLMQKHIEREHPGVQYKEDSFNLSVNRSKPRSKPFIGPLSIQKRRQNIIGEKLPQKTASTTASSYSGNNTSNTGPKQYACAYCHYETNTQEDILKHTRKSHSHGIDLSSGAKSPGSFKNSSNPQDHLLACWDGSKKAVKRKMQIENDEGIQRKRRFIFEKGNELIQCGHCDTKETSVSRMQDHMTWDHPGLPYQAKRIPAWRFICRSCAVKTMATSKMKYHLNRHVNYRPYTCTDCGAFFPSPDQCRRHSRSQGHEEQYTYVRNPKKESRVSELLEGTRQLALKVQEEAAKDQDFDISKTDSFIAKFQENKSNLKRSVLSGSAKKTKKSKAAKAASAHVTEEDGEGTEEEQSKKQRLGKSPQTVGVEQDITIRCYYCEFTSGNVSNISIHHNQSHPGKKFLWTEVERGFTCDKSGEALPDCDTLPSASADVGYTTRMTLGSGSNTMRFKCKTCDFSSCVIQAMKSHLKSHQPKGFICPYCSRSFSGKEKLMRHQYCLHKGLALWVIHLRMSGVVGSVTVKKGKNSHTEDSTLEITTDDPSCSSENSKMEIGSVDKQQTKTSSNVTVFLCNKCPYTSESLYQFRFHLAQQHEEFKHKIQDTSTDSPLKCGYCPFLAESEADFSSHIVTHFNDRNFLCGYCDYSAYDRSKVEHHLESTHSSLDPKIVELGTSDVTGEVQDKKVLPLLVNLQPSVALEKISESVLSQYWYPRSEDENTSEDDEIEKEEDSDEIEKEEDSDEIEKEEDSDEIEKPAEVINENNQHRRSSMDTLSKDEDDDDERLMIVEGVSDMVDGEDNDEGKFVLEKDNVKSRVTDSEKLVREIGFVEDQTAGVLGCSDTDMMILQFGCSPVDPGSHFQDETIEDGAEGEMVDQAENVNLITSTNVLPVIRSADYTLFLAQERDSQDDNVDEDDDIDMNFGSDMTLSSPLPMISLGDGVAMSPVNLISAANNDDVDDSMLVDSLEEDAVDENCDVLLDV